METKKYRSIFISDLHLGSRGSKAEHITSFLKFNECEYLYLVGDIIDGWRLKKAHYWPQEHSNVIRRILTKAKRGCKVVYITGNHDEFIRKFSHYELKMGNISVVNEDVHTMKDGREFLLIHGDLYDGITTQHKWVALFGDVGYNFLLWLNRLYNWFRARLGFGYWSLSAFVKKKVKNAVSFMHNFEMALVHECKKRGFDGVIAGHIHNAALKELEGVTYGNCGDWVESCTALVEHLDGRLEIIYWAEIGHEGIKEKKKKAVKKTKKT